MPKPTTSITRIKPINKVIPVRRRAKNDFTSDEPWNLWTTYVPAISETTEDNNEKIDDNF